jgi:uncharacterized protein YdhG (YjbR/CyaY superfamily)
VTASPTSVADYIAKCSPLNRSVIRRVRSTIIRAVPKGATETISYRMPAYMFHGVVVYFAAFKNHIGLYPPVRGDAKLMADLSPYAGKKGNLKFPLDQPIPCALIARIVKLRVKQNLVKFKAKNTSKPGA